MERFFLQEKGKRAKPLHLEKNCGRIIVKDKRMKGQKNHENFGY